MSVDAAIVSTYEDYRRAIRAVVQQLADDDILAELSKADRPYLDRDHRYVTFRAMVKVEARKRGIDQ